MTKAEAKRDLAFIREIQGRLKAGREKCDPTQTDFAEQMLRDWEDELARLVGEAQR